MREKGDGRDNVKGGKSRGLFSKNLAQQLREKGYRRRSRPIERAEPSVRVRAARGAAAIGVSMSQDTIVDDWSDVGRLDEAAAAGVPAALRQLAERDAERNGEYDALQPTAHSGARRRSSRSATARTI